jgi:protein tyrosine phosphatase (PTP) superfamily phosphohydrolase (DUF442 family)
MIKNMIKIVAVLLGLAVVALAIPVWLYFPGHNFRTVEPWAFYGSRQMGERALEKTIQKRNIKTVINLRGHNPGSPWYDVEVAVCERLGIAHENFSWSKNSLPDPESLMRFIEVIETGERPFLAHCAGGTHRTGVAAAVYLLLKGANIASARKEFGPFFNNAPIGQLVDLYEGSDMPFKQWAQEIYPGLYESLQTSQASAPGLMFYAMARVLS